VHLVRRDRVRAAVSAYVAVRTGVFRALDADALTRTRADVPYDYDGILRCLAALDRAQAQWLRFFEAHRIEPIRLAYETLTARFDETMRDLFERLGHRPPALPRPRLTRQAADVSEGLVRQFLRDDARLRHGRS
jgi:LPS sulfotransferase NodH